MITRLWKIGWSVASRRARKSVGTLPAHTTGEAEGRRCNLMRFERRRCVIECERRGQCERCEDARARCAAVCSLWEEFSTLGRIVFESELRQAACRRTVVPLVPTWHAPQRGTVTTSPFNLMCGNTKRWLLQDNCVTRVNRHARVISPWPVRCLTVCPVVLVTHTVQ